MLTFSCCKCLFIYFPIHTHLPITWFIYIYVCLYYHLTVWWVLTLIFWYIFCCCLPRFYFFLYYYLRFLLNYLYKSLFCVYVCMFAYEYVFFKYNCFDTINTWQTHFTVAFSVKKKKKIISVRKIEIEL